MSSVSLAHVLELAAQLNPEDKRALAVRLQLDHLGAFAHEVTRESCEERRLALKAAGTFEHAQSLAGRYGPPRLDISEEELHTTIRAAAAEWEEELDELSSGRDKQGPDLRQRGAGY